MFKKFTEGLVFGSGFGISFVVIWYVVAYLIYPILLESKAEQAISKHLSNNEIDNQPYNSHDSKEIQKLDDNFDKLGVEDKILKSSVIALVKFEPTTGGKTKAIIKEFLKKESNAVFYYNVGDEYSNLSYVPEKGTKYGDGEIIFFTGSPAMMKEAYSYMGDRIYGLGDMPIELFKKKCKG